MNVTETISALQARRGGWPELAKQAGVSYSWLVKFAGGKIADPRVNTLAAIQQVLRGDEGSQG